MNVNGTVKDGYLTLVIKVDEATIAKAEPSKSGKSKMVATTSGFVGFGGVRASVNVIA